MRYQMREYTLSKKYLLIILCLLFGIMLFSSIRISTMHPNRISASSVNIQHREKIITRVFVKQDDTLWDYACQYYSEEYRNVEELIFEIRKTNGLSDDLIKEGSYLLIPHYVTTESESNSQYE